MAMKKLLLICILLSLNSCGKSKQEIPNFSDFDYDDFQEAYLEYNSLFYVQKSYYFAYIYSKHCGHCNNIKYKVFEFYYAHKDSFYFIEYSSLIEITDNVVLTIGATSVCDVRILGTPTLLLIDNWTLSKNIAGEKEILNFMNEI